MEGAAIKEHKEENNILHVCSSATSLKIKAPGCTSSILLSSPGTRIMGPAAWRSCIAVQSCIAVKSQSLSLIISTLKVWNIVEVWNTVEVWNMVPCWDIQLLLRILSYVGIPLNPHIPHNNMWALAGNPLSLCGRCGADTGLPLIVPLAARVLPYVSKPSHHRQDSSTGKNFEWSCYWRIE